MADENFVAEAWSLCAIGVCMVALRLYARHVFTGLRNLRADDGLMILAGLLYTAETVAAYVVGAYWDGLANNNMTDEQRAALSPDSEEWRLRVGGSKTQLLGWLVYTVLLWTLKFSWIIYYSRLTLGINNMPIRIKIGYVALTVTFLATFCAILFGCWPVQKHWQIYPDPGPHCYPANSIIQLAVLLSLNISTDLYLMSIPLPMIWKARLSLKKKAVLLPMFGGGFLVMVFGILRCTTILTSGVNGPEQAGRWSCRESFTAVFVGNLPMIYPLLQRWFTGIREYHEASSGKASSGTNIQLSSQAASSTTKANKSRKKNFKHPLSIPNDTAWGSDEAIVESIEMPPDNKEPSTRVTKSLPPSTQPVPNTQSPDIGSTAEIRSQMPASVRGPETIHVTSEYSIESSLRPDSGHGTKNFSRSTFGPY